MSRPVVWTLLATELPRVPRRCPRCDTTRPFVSSGKFRVNAQKRRLDVWLVHRCEACDETWNASIHERKRPEELGPDLRRYEDNDAEAARRCAFAVAGADRAVPFVVVRPELEGTDPDELAIVFRLEDPLDVRVDRVLARELGLPRAAIEARGRVSDGQVVKVSLRRREDRSGSRTSR